jgi:hypothetical protein
VRYSPSSTEENACAEAERLRVVDLEGRRLDGKIADGRGERTRGRHAEVCRECVAVGPVLEEHETVRILDVVMHRVQEAARLEPGAVNVLQAEP